MITIWMAVSLGGGTAFFMCCSKCFHKVSTSLAVLQYFPESTGVLPLQYCSTFVEVLDFMNSTDFMKE